MKTASALILAGTAVAIAVLAAPVHAGEDAGPAFFTLHVPGGRSTIRLAGIRDSVPNGAVLPLLVRLLHADPPGSTAEQDDRLSRVRDRVERLGRVDVAVATLGPGGLSLPASDADDPTQARIGAALASLGLRLSGGSAAVQAEPDPAADAAATREALADAGLDLESLASTLNGGGAVVPKVADLELPAPLDEATWRSVPLGTVPKELTFETVLLDRHAALNLHGLLAMTPSTRSWLAANHSVLARLAYRPAMVSSFGRSLRITDGVVDLPGGPPAAAAWEALARSPVSPAERFVVALFARDEGRLAYFYDTVMRLAPDQQAAALGLSNSGAPDLESLEETYDAFVESLGEWRPFERPFMRPLFDGALVLDELSWRAGGKPAGPRWRRFWSIALDDPALPGKPERLLRRVDRDGEIGPGVLIRATTLANVDERRARFELIRFVQRVMPDPPDASLPDVLLAVRAYRRYPALMLQLERLGITDPAVFARAGRLAASLDGIGSDAKRVQAIAQVQGALVLIDNAAASRYLPIADASRLAVSLLAVEPKADEYQGRIAQWIDRALLPALGLGPAADAGAVEEAVLRSWSGPRDATRADLAWEGQRYVVDPADAELERLSRLRSIQGPSGLGETVALARTAAALAAARTADEAAPLAAELERIAAALPPVSTASLPDLAPLADCVPKAVSEVGRLVLKSGDARRTSAAVAPLLRHADRSLARALLSLAYTRHLGDPEGTVLNGDDMAVRHEFGRAGTPSEAWSRPRDSGDETGRHMHGALLGLDLALARLSLRLLSVQSVPPPRTVNQNVIDLVRENVTLAFRHPPSAPDLALVAAALERGRQRVAAAVTNASELTALAGEAHVSEWRREALPWMAREEPDRVASIFTGGELFELGGDAPLPAAFGTSASGIDACWCLRVPRVRPWEDVAARPGMPRVAAQVPDVGLRLAELMQGIGVPAQVYPALLAFAAQEFIDHAAPTFPEDWPALTAAAADVSRERVEDYVSGLVGTGPLRIRQESAR